jgi:cell division topological specificity factor
MASLFDRFMGRKEPSSAEIAKERLKLVLVTDRSNLSPEKLSEMQAEIINVIKRYLSIEDTDVQIKYEQRDRKNYLVADISLNRDRNYGAFEAPAVPGSLADDALWEDAPAEPEDAPAEAGDAPSESDESAAESGKAAPDVAEANAASDAAANAAESGAVAEDAPPDEPD